MLRLLALWLTLACGIAGVQAQISDLPPHQMSKDSIMLHLATLCSKDMAGRGTGHEGYDRAADFIASRLLNAGLEPFYNEGRPENPFLLNVPYGGERLVGASFGFGKKTLKFGEDFLTGTGVATSSYQIEEVVFVGFGQEYDHYNDLGKADLNGKWVVALPGWIDDEARYTTTRKVREQYEALVRKGVAGVILVDPDYKKNSKRMFARLTSERVYLNDSGKKISEKRNSTPLIILSPKAGKQLFKAMKVRPKAEIRKRVKGREVKPVIRKLSLSVAFQVDHRDFSSPNVAAYVRGNELAEEFVVLSAHLDHLGIHDGEVYYGADDNGSGSTALLSIAQQWAEWQHMGFQPRRSVLFVWFSGEENGLLGSRFFTDNLPGGIQSDLIIANLNTDMVGRHDDRHGSKDRYIYVIGADRISSQLHELQEAVNERCCQMTLDYTYNDPKDPNQYYRRSDHYNFVKLGVPSIFYFSGMHADYHKPTDTIEKIDFDRIKTVTELILYTSWEISRREYRFKPDRR